MPNAGKKHHLQPKRDKMKASEFWFQYQNSVEDLNRAIQNATKFEDISRETASRQEDKLKKKYSLSNAGFWSEVRSHLVNYKKKLQEKK
jgi:hypothetical protein